MLPEPCGSEVQVNAQEINKKEEIIEKREKQTFYYANTQSVSSSQSGLFPLLSHGPFALSLHVTHSLGTCSH